MPFRRQPGIFLSHGPIGQARVKRIRTRHHGRRYFVGDISLTKRYRRRYAAATERARAALVPGEAPSPVERVRILNETHSCPPDGDSDRDEWDRASTKYLPEILARLREVEPEMLAVDPLELALSATLYPSSPSTDRASHDAHTAAVARELAPLVAEMCQRVAAGETVKAVRAALVEPLRQTEEWRAWERAAEGLAARRMKPVEQARYRAEVFAPAFNALGLGVRLCVRCGQVFVRAKVDHWPGCTGAARTAKSSTKNRRQRSKAAREEKVNAQIDIQREQTEKWSIEHFARCKRCIAGESCAAREAKMEGDKVSEAKRRSPLTTEEADAVNQREGNRRVVVPKR